MTTIRQTTKYLAAVTAAKKAACFGKHTTAEQLYDKLDGAGYWWDSKLSKWVQRESVDPSNEVNREVVRVRITSHMDGINERVNRVIRSLKEVGFEVKETSKLYINNRPADGGARVYVTVEDVE